MGWLTALRGTTVALDTAPPIYFIEENPRYLPAVLPFFEAWDRGEFSVVTSTITLAEVLAHPLRRRDAKLAGRYRRILTQASGLQTIPVTIAVAEEAARLRSLHSLKTPDAIQLATAILLGASTVLTNDARWPTLPNLQILLADDLETLSP